MTQRTLLFLTGLATACLGVARADVSDQLPGTVTGGTGTLAGIQSADGTTYDVAKGNTLNVGGFAAVGGDISSVVLHVKFSVQSGGYSGTNAILVNGVSTGIVPTSGDTDRSASIDITAGNFRVNTWPELTALAVSFTNNDANPAQSVYFDQVHVVVTHTPKLFDPPTWSDEFDDSGPPNPNIWTFEQGFVRNEELQWYQSNNAWQEGGNLIIEGRREQVLNPNYVSGSTDWKKNRQYAEYTSSSIISSGKYSFQYGRMQVRAKLPCFTGSWPAIWTLGDTGEWPSNGECDVLEYYMPDSILANCAVGTTTRWTAKWDSIKKPVSTWTPVSPNWRTEYHVWTMQWDDQNVRLYMDNYLMNTIPQTWLVNAVTTWGPAEPFKQPHFILLNLAIGGAGGDPSGTTYPIRYEIDHVRVWEGLTNNNAPTDVALSANTIQEGLPIGTVVGDLTATDVDAAEIHSFTLVTGTGSTHNASFEIVSFSGETKTSVLRTKAVLNLTDGATRSIRVRVTDIEGATYEKVLAINVQGRPEIEVSASAVSVPEGGSQTFNVRLRTLPAGNITVGVVRQSGDTNITVSSGASLTFTPGNGTSWQTVTLAAAEDADKTNGVATILCSDASATYSSVSVTATEADNDNTPPLVDAGPDDIVFLTGSTPWTPAELALSAWYDASDPSTLTSSAGTVSQWRDKSGNANHLTVGSGKDPKTGTHTMGGRNAIDFSSDYFTMTSSIEMLGKAAFLAVETDAIGANQILLSKSGTNVQLRIYQTGGGIQYAAAAPYYPTSPVSTSTLTALQPAVIGYLLDASMKFSVDGTYEDSASGNDGSGSTIYDLIGCRGDNLSNFFDGRIGEVVITSTLPTIADRQKLEGYLAHRWGTAARLAANHFYLDAPPTLATIAANLDGTVTDPDGQTLSVTWTKVSGPGAVTFGNANAVDTTAGFSVAGTYVLRLTVSDGVAVTTDDVTMVVSAPNTYSTWAAGVFAKPFSTIGYTRNPDGDALTNLQEFAFGTDPTDPVTRALAFVENGALTSTGAPITVVNGGTRLAVFSRRKDHATAGLTYTVQFSADMINWTTSADTPSRRTSASDPGNYEAVSVPYPTSVPTPRFFKVGVTAN